MSTHRSKHVILAVYISQYTCIISQAVHKIKEYFILSKTNNLKKSGGIKLRLFDQGNLSRACG